jgi:hypothetical protein
VCHFTKAVAGKEITMAQQKVAFLVFDVESVADGELVAQVRYPAERLAPDEAIARYMKELVEETGSDFIPYTYQVPISITVAKVSPDFALVDVIALDKPEFRPRVMTETFWRGWQHYGRPTLVSFNGRSFDIPLLELAAFRFGISVPRWFHSDHRPWHQPRNRYNLTAHLDLQDVLVNYGATRFSGGLNLAARLLGKPGKMEVRGDTVQALYDAGELNHISDYCCCDVLDTYFVFLRYLVLCGKLTSDGEQVLVAAVKEWLLQRREDCPVYHAYLEHWTDWTSLSPSEAERSEGILRAP